MKKIIFILFLKAIFFLPSAAYAQIFWHYEGAATWQTRNDQAIPGNTGTRFSISDVDQGPFFTSRLYLGYKWDQNEIRALYAPLKLKFDTQFSNPVDFFGETFSANTPTHLTYQFNSYRLTYTRLMENDGDWTWGWGFTGKIRDAAVGVAQAGTEKIKTNVGFVPLLHFQAARPIHEDWSFRFDFDGLAAPQGRAFDLAFFIEKKLNDRDLNLFSGYRMVEGGADNNAVYNFAWFHFLTIGLRGEF